MSRRAVSPLLATSGQIANVEPAIVGVRRSSLLRSPAGQLREYPSNQQTSSSFSPSLSPNAESVARRRKSALQNGSDPQQRGVSSLSCPSSSPIDEQNGNGKSSNNNARNSSFTNTQSDAHQYTFVNEDEGSLGLSSRCLVPVAESTKTIVPLGLVVLLASICDLVSLRSSSLLTLRESGSSTGPGFGMKRAAGEQKSLGGVGLGSSELAGGGGGSAAHVLWTLCGGDPRGRGAISYKRMRSVMLRETGIDLGCSKNDFLGGGAVARDVQGDDRMNAALRKQRLVKILPEEGNDEYNSNSSNTVHFVNNKTKGEKRREKEDLRDMKIDSTSAVQTNSATASIAVSSSGLVEGHKSASSSLPTLGDFLMGNNACTPRATDTTEGSMRPPNNSAGTTAAVSASQQQQQRHHISSGPQAATAGASRLEPPAEDPRSDIILFSEVEAFFETTSFSRDNGENPDSNNEASSALMPTASSCTYDSILQRAIASMAAAHEGRRKGSGFMSFDEDAILQRRAKNGSQASIHNNNGSGGNQQYHHGEGEGLIEDHQRETANLTTLLFLEYFYSPALADSPHLQGVGGNGTNGTGGIVVGFSSAAVGSFFSSSFSPSSPSHPSFSTKSEIPAARVEQKPSSLPYTVKDRTTIDALNEAIVSTWDTLAVLIGEPSARGKLNNPLDPKAHCLKKALYAFRGLIGVGEGTEGAMAGQTDKKMNYLSHSSSPHSAVLQSNKRLQGNCGKQNGSNGTKAKAKAIGGQDGQVGVASIGPQRNATSSDQSTLSELQSDKHNNSNAKSNDGNKNTVIERSGVNLMLGLGALIKNKKEPAKSAAKDLHSSPTIKSATTTVAPSSTLLREKLPALIRNGKQTIADVDVLLGKLERQKAEDKAAMRMRELATAASDSNFRGVKRHEGAGGGSLNDLEYVSSRKERKRKQLEDAMESPLRRRMERLRELAAFHGITLENDPRGSSDVRRPTHEASNNKNIDCGVELLEGCGREGCVLLSVDFQHDTSSRSRIVVPSPGGEVVLPRGVDQSLGLRRNDRGAVVLVDASVQTDPVRRPKQKVVDSSELVKFHDEGEGDQRGT